MANRVIEFVKEHPITVGALAVGIIALYVLYSSGSSGGTTVVSTYDPNAAQQADQYALQQQGLQYSYAAQQGQQATQVALAQIQSNTQLANIDASRIVSLAGIQAQQNVQTAGQATQVQLAQIAANTNEQQIGATIQLGLGQAATYAHIADVNAQTQLGIVQATSAAQTEQAYASAAALTAASLAGKNYATVGLKTASGTQLNVNTGKKPISSGISLPGFGSFYSG